MGVNYVENEEVHVENGGIYVKKCTIYVDFGGGFGGHINTERGIKPPSKWFGRCA
jgi:hypothetical protein